MRLDHEIQIITRRIRRALWALIGAGIFFWIGYEDRSTFIPIILGVLIAAALSLNLGHIISTGRLRWPRVSVGIVIVGLVAGMLAMPLAAILILVKISLHGHIPPDFTLVQVLAVLGRTPVWAGVGTLIGLSLALWIRHHQD